MQHRDKIILEKITSEIDIALNIMGNTAFAEFENSEILKRSICMTVINIGELVKNISADFRLEHNEIPWKDIAGFRDMAAHKYRTLDMIDVYDTVINDFPKLKSNILKILQDTQNRKSSLEEQIKAAETRQTQSIQQKEKNTGLER